MLYYARLGRHVFAMFCVTMLCHAMLRYVTQCNTLFYALQWGPKSFHPLWYTSFVMLCNGALTLSTLMLAAACPTLARTLAMLERNELLHTHGEMLMANGMFDAVHAAGLKHPVEMLETD